MPDLQTPNPLKNANLRFKVYVLWGVENNATQRHRIDGVTGYKLENEVYYLYTEVEEGLDVCPFETIWVKNPNLISMKFVPYLIS